MGSLLHKLALTLASNQEHPLLSSQVTFIYWLIQAISLSKYEIPSTLEIQKKPNLQPNRPVSWGFYFHDETIWPKFVREKRVDFTQSSIYQFIIKGYEGGNPLRAWTWRQEIIQRPWSSVIYWFDHHGSLSAFV